MGEWRRAVQAAGSGGDAAALRPLMVSLEEAATECAAEAGLYYDLAETDFSDEGEEEEAAEDQSPLWRTAKARSVRRGCPRTQMCIPKAVASLFFFSLRSTVFPRRQICVSASNTFRTLLRTAPDGSRALAGSRAVALGRALRQRPRAPRFPCGVVARDR